MASAAPSSRCDSDRFTAAMLAYWPELLRYCARFSESGDDVEDLAQATLIVAWHQRRRYRGDGSFKGWLLRIARTVGLRAIRSRQHQRDMNETLCNMAFLERDHDELCGLTEELAHIIDAIVDLPHRQQSAVLWRYVGGYSIEEVATGLGCAPGTIKASCHSAMRLLRARLTEMDRRPMRSA